VSGIHARTISALSSRWRLTCVLDPLLYENLFDNYPDSLTHIVIIFDSRGMSDEYSQVSGPQPEPEYPRRVTGWPSPAEEHYDGPLSLDAHLIGQPTATFVLRAAAGLEGLGINGGDELVVDRSLRARDGSIIIAVVAGELVVRRLSMYPPRLEAGPGRPDLPIPEDGAAVWGVVTVVIHHV